MQDSKGYIWLGTSNGVARWNSKNFQTFTIESGLPDNEVLFAFEDSRHRIWFSCNSDELSYFFNGKIYDKKTAPFLSKLRIAPGSKLDEINEELYFFSKNSVLSKYNFRSGKITSFQPQHDFASFYFINDKRKIWAVENNLRSPNKLVSPENSSIEKALLQPNYPDTRLITKVDYEHKKYYFQYGLDSPFYQSGFSSKDFQWALFNKGDILEITRDHLYFRRSDYSIPVEYSGFPSLFMLKDLFLMVTTGDPICCRQVPILEYNHRFGSNNIRFLFKHAGLVYAINMRSQIADIRTGRIVNAFKDVNIMYSLRRFKDTYYLAAGSNIFSFTHPYAKINAHTVTPDDNFKDIAVYQDSDILFTAHGRMLYQINPTRTKARLIAYSSKGLFHSLFLDHKKRLWYSSSNKIYYSSNLDTPLTGSRLFVLDKKNPVTCNRIMEDSHGNMFFVTNSGIFVYDGKLIYRIDKNNLLTDNNCTQLLLNETDNSLWVATKRGVNHIRYIKKIGKLQFEVINKFLKTDGLCSDVINDLLLDSNKLYIATDKGINVLLDVNYRPDKQVIPVYLNLTAINGHPNTRASDRELQLDHSQNNLTLSLDILYYKRRDRIKVYAYLYHNDKLAAQSIVREDKIEYLSLDDGSYKLMLKVYDLDYPYIYGSATPYYFTISPPYYKTWWFIAGSSALFFIGSGGFLFRNLNKRRRRQLEQFSLKAKLNESNLKSLQGQMNPHFVFNSLNTLQYFIVGQKEKEALDYLSDFSGLMRDILEQSVNTMVSLEQEIKFLNKYIQLEQIRFNHSFEFSLILNMEEEEVSNIRIPTMLLQPILENAVKHGVIHAGLGQGSIVLKMALSNNHMLRVAVTNTGKPIRGTPSEGNTIAIKTIKERLSLYTRNGVKGDFSLTITNSGAIALINIPV